MQRYYNSGQKTKNDICSYEVRWWQQVMLIVSFVCPHRMVSLWSDHRGTTRRRARPCESLWLFSPPVQTHNWQDVWLWHSPPCLLSIRGFCYFNSVAVAAKLLQQRLNVSKILIVDWVSPWLHSEVGGRWRPQAHFKRSKREEVKISAIWVRRWNFFSFRTDSHFHGGTTKPLCCLQEALGHVPSWRPLKGLFISSRLSKGDWKFSVAPRCQATLVPASNIFLNLFTNPAYQRIIWGVKNEGVPGG